jgi:riboflavin kinase/FMN adenylyltransferase
MKIHKGYDNLKFRNPVVTMGIFDGVHRGHRALIDILTGRAKEYNGESVVITFYPHPRIVLENDHINLSFLTTMEEKQDLLREAGVDHLIIQEFSREFSEIKACDFVKDIIISRLRSNHLIVGYDHRFGKEGEGDFETIRQCPDLEGFTVERSEVYMNGDEAISSSSIRELLLSGKIEEANELLGYPYRLSGSVVSGRHIGHSLGFPTANIKPQNEYKLIPGNGVYAVIVVVGGQSYMGMLSIGTNPTVSSNAGRRSIEVHILDFGKDIYGSDITVHFHDRLRSEKKFENLTQLAEQMEIDKQDTIRCLS